MEININNISYVDVLNSTAKLIAIPVEGQTFEYKPQNIINAQNYTLSKRNSAGLYILPTEKEKLYLNFIPIKTYVSDQNLIDYIGNDFTFFVDDPLIPRELFTLPDGQIFRCVTETSLPTSPENYVYYIMVDGIAKRIPNYKTLEVMMNERGMTLIGVRIITEQQCEDIPKQGEVPDKSAAWTSDMEDITTAQKLKALENNVKTGQQLAAGATAAATQQIDAVKAQAAADKAAADAAKAEAEAAKTASEAAIADAQAQIAAIQAQQSNT